MSRIVPLFVVLAILLPITSSAQTLWEPSTGVSVRSMRSTSPTFLLAGPNPGEGLAVWADSRTDQWDLYGQLLDNDGNSLWEESGRPLIEAPGKQVSTEGLALDDGWLLIWGDDRNQPPNRNGALYLQRFDFNGTPLWSQPPNPASHGVRFYPDDRVVLRHAFMPDGEGGLYLATYTDAIDDETREIRVFRLLLSTGERDPEWPVDGVLFEFESTVFKLKLEPDRTNGVLVVAQLHDGAYVQRIGRDGVVRWNQPTYQRFHNTEAFTCTDGAGGLYIAWTREHYPNQQIRINHIGPFGGTAASLFGIGITPFEPDQPEVLQLVPSDSGSAILIGQATYPHTVVVAQRISGTDELQFHWDEPTTIPYTDWHSQEFFISDGDGGVMLLFDNDDPALFAHILRDGSVGAVTNLDLLSSRSLVSNWVNGQLGIMYKDIERGIRYQKYDLVSQSLVLEQHGRLILETEPDVNVKPRDKMILRDDKAYICWLDCRGGPYMQILDIDDGSPQFEQNGVAVLPAAEIETSTLNYRLGIALDDDQHLFVASSQAVYSPDSYEAVLQKMSPAGQPLWGDHGVVLNQPPDYHMIYQITPVPDGSGGVYTLMSFHDGPMAVAHHDQNGTPLWGDGDADYRVLPELGNNGQLMDQQWLVPGESFLVLYIMNQNLYLSLRDVDGEVLWTTPPQPSRYDTQLRVLNDTILTVWNYKQSSPEEVFVRGQLYDLDGNPLWGTDPVDLHQQSSVNTLECSISGPDTDSFWVGWTGGYPYFASAQRFWLDGTPVFDQPIVTDGWQSIKVLALEDGGGYLCADKNTGNNFENRLLSVYIAADGMTTSQQYHFGINAANVFLSDIAPDGDGGAILLWDDDRTVNARYDVYAQRLNQQITSAPAPSSELPSQFSLSSPYPNPFNATATVSVTLPSPGELNASLFNILGQEVMTLAHGPYAAGMHTLTIDASTLASGIYIVRAEVDDGAAVSRKIVLLK